MSIHLILGGARSGKSAYAEKLAIETGLPVTYIATAQVYDGEFKQRVQHHKDRRPIDWHLIEAPYFLSTALQDFFAQITAKQSGQIGQTGQSGQSGQNRQCIMIDCLTLWLAQCICPDCAPTDGVDWPQQRALFLENLPTFDAEIIIVSNEVGMGIVPLGVINRQFQDEQGRLNQAVAAIADKVSFIAAGFPIHLKG